MKPKWLIEDFHADNQWERLADEVKRQGMECHVIEYRPFESTNYSIYPENSNVVVQCSLNMALDINSRTKWYPGAWLNIEKYECSYFYAYVGDYLLNDDYIFLPINQVERIKPWLFQEFVVNGRIFIRPSSGLKSFTGQLFDYDLKGVDVDWSWVRHNTDSHTLCVIAKPKIIAAEWRVVMADGEPIACSKYKEDGNSILINEAPMEVINVARNVLCCIEPDPMFTIDIAMTSTGKYKLLEIGSFSCAGLYACDMEPIVRKASEIAEREWKSVNEKIL